LWETETRRKRRQDVADENCPHCWTPCEAYPTLLGNLGRATVAKTGPSKPLPTPITAS
jgi:hypothetical protein